jgi:hypothetical protein
LALEEPNVRPMDFTGRPMRTTVFVEPAGYAADEALAPWIERALEHTSALPPTSARR